jgi:hypothetical protein
VKITSVRTRLTLWNVGVLSLVLAAFGTAVRHTYEAKLTGSVEGELARRGRHMLGIWMRMGGPPPPPPDFSPPGAGEGRGPGGEEEHGRWRGSRAFDREAVGGGGRSPGGSACRGYPCWMGRTCFATARSTPPSLRALYGAGRRGGVIESGAEA